MLFVVKLIIQAGVKVGNERLATARQRAHRQVNLVHGFE